MRNTTLNNMDKYKSNQNKTKSTLFFFSFALLSSALPLMAGFPQGIPRSLLSNDTLSISSTSINITVPINQLCQPFCDPLNDSGCCLTPCIDYCPNICRNSLLSCVPTPDDPLPPSSIYYSPEVSSGEFHRSSSMSVFLITIFVAISVAFVVTCIYGLLVWARQRRRGAGPGAAEFLQRDVEIRDDDFLDEDRGPIIDHPIWFIRTVGLEASVIDAIAICRYKRGEGLVQGTDCSICLSEFKEDETLRLLPKCSHAFHIQCIDTWLCSRTNCPVCRAPVLADGRHRVPDPIREGNLEDPVLTSDLVDHESVEGEDDVDHSPQTDGLELDEGRKIRRLASVDSLSNVKISVEVSNASREGDSVVSMKNVAHLDKNLVRLACRNLSAATAATSSSSIRRTKSLSWSGRFLSTTACPGRNRSTILPL